MTPPFVKKFDFRGEYGKEIHDKDAYYLGLAVLKTISLKKVLVGWDTRISSKNLAYNFINALTDKGVEIYYLDKCPIDYVTASAFAFDFDLSVMFTGSHNPWTWTGLLMHTRGGDSVQGEMVQKILDNYDYVLDNPYNEDQIDLSKFKNFYEDVEKLVGGRVGELIPLDKIKATKVAVDLGDGSGSRALALLEKLLPQVKFERINDRNIYDQDTPHTADPSELKNMEQLINHMKLKDYNCGFAFDSDADRVLAVDDNCEYVNGSLIGAAHVDSFVILGLSDRVFGYAVDCGPSMQNSVTDENKKLAKDLQIKPIPIGRSLVRRMLRDGEIDFGAENVGHFYSKDFFMTDSGIFSMAVILYWISINGQLSNLKKNHPDGFRGQIFTNVMSQEEIDGLVLEINNKIGIQESKKIEQDGIRYEFYENDYLSSWYTIRKSGYEAITKCYYGALDEERFEYLKDMFNPKAKV